jgi:hypothetical protein
MRMPPEAVSAAIISSENPVATADADSDNPP